MKRLRLLLAKENVSPYIDIFLNHGNILVFPWLMAHHHSFFGNFNNLAILDVLLTHKRGYNVNIGSKKRKFYFSDVNHILRKCSEPIVACCEKFKPTLHYHSTSKIEDCKTTTHLVADNEGFEVYLDSFDDLIDVNCRLEKREKKINVNIEELNTTGNKGLSLLIKKFLNFTKKNIEEVFDEEQIMIIKSEKLMRAEKIKVIEEEIDLLKSEISSMPPLRRMAIIQNIDKDILKRVNNFKTIVRSILTFLKEHEYVTDPLMMVTHLYNENKSDFFRSDNVEYNSLVSEYFKRKKEKKFLSIGEIEHLCNKYYLSERVDFYNETFHEFEELRKECLSMTERGEVPPRSKFISIRDQKDKLQKEVKPLIELYNSIDRSFGDEETFKLPKNMKAVINFLNNKDDEYGDFWDFLRRGQADNKLLIEGLECLKRKIEEDCEFVNPSDDLELIKIIDDIREDVKRNILEGLNYRCDINKKYIDDKANEIKSIRKKYIEGLNHKVLDFQKLHLSSHEEKKLNDAVDYLTSEEASYCSSKNNFEKKTTSLLWEQQNRNLFYRRYGVPKDLSSENWHKEVYKIEEPAMLKQIATFEHYIKVFEDICGVSPYGVLIGSYNIDESKHIEVDCPLKLRGESSNKMMFENALDLSLGHVKGTISIDSIGSDYLLAAKRGIVRDLNNYSNVKKSELNDKLKKKMQERVMVMERGGLEVLYDSITSETETNHEIVLKSGIKICNPDSNPIEKHYKSKLNRRKMSDETFKRIVTDFAIKSKNVYEELEVEEAIVESNEIIEKLFDYEEVPYYLSDFKRMRLYKMEKNRMRVEAEENEIKGFDLIKEYNKFNLNHCSNNNKQYNVSELISYIKILFAFKLLKINVNASIYSIFGLKKCQSTYIKNNLVSFAQRLFKAYSFKY